MATTSSDLDAQASRSERFLEELQRIEQAAMTRATTTRDKYSKFTSFIELQNYREKLEKQAIAQAHRERGELFVRSGLVTNIRDLPGIRPIVRATVGRDRPKPSNSTTGIDNDDNDPLLQSILERSRLESEQQKTKKNSHQPSSTTTTKENQIIHSRPLIQVPSGDDLVPNTGKNTKNTSTSLPSSSSSKPKQSSSSATTNNDDDDDLEAILAQVAQQEADEALARRLELESTRKSGSTKTNRKSIDEDSDSALAAAIAASLREVPSTTTKPNNNNTGSNKKISSEDSEDADLMEAIRLSKMETENSRNNSGTQKSTATTISTTRTASSLVQASLNTASSVPSSTKFGNSTTTTISKTTTLTPTIVKPRTTTTTATPSSTASSSNTNPSPNAFSMGIAPNRRTVGPSISSSSSSLSTVTRPGTKK